jgi:hypothetical protein
MATATDIINAAYKKIGFSDVSDPDRVEALVNLNNLVSSWGAEFLNYYTVRESLVLTIGTATYTIGRGGNLSTIRPVSLKDAILRNSEGSDIPLNVVAARDYNEVTSKAWDGKPSAVYFLPEYPLAKVIFDCEPFEAYTAYFDFEKNFTEFASIGAAMSLPPEYKEALVYNLAISLAEDKGIIVPVTGTVRDTAQRLKTNLDRLNAVNKPVPEAKFDFQSGVAFDISTGE